MRAQMRVLAALVTLVCIYTPARGAESCRGFRHLENGRTFFRYGGLLVTFHCRPGYKLHGYKTNSCVSGHWSRDPPVCVGSGCSNPGSLTNGTTSMNEDGSWVVFSCDSGFQLRGPSMLYCKGHTWNSTKPVCKESDMMSSVSIVSLQKTNLNQNLRDAIILKAKQQPHYDILTNTVFKGANPKVGLSHTSSQMSNNERIKITSAKVHLQQHIQLTDFKIKAGNQTTHEAQLREADEGPESGTEGRGSEAVASHKAAERLDEVTQVFASEERVSAAVSSTSSFMPGTEQPTSSLQSSSPAHAQTVTAVRRTCTTVKLAPASPHRPTTSDLPLLGSENHEDQQAESGLQYPPVDTQEPTRVYTSSSPSSGSPPASSVLYVSSPHGTISASTGTVSRSTESSMETQPPLVTPSSNTARTTGHHSPARNTTSEPPLLSQPLSRRPVCSYPPVPAHGTFYFRNVENPGAGEYRHYIQYACYPGYTLAHGDARSYCLQGGTWSGLTPVCLELTPCSVNNGGCSQLCSYTHNNSRSSNHTETRTQCYCRPGFILLDDGRTCRDVDECAEGQHPCRHRCINTFGSFKCSCDDGYQPAHDKASCTDVDECLLPVAVTGCVFGCVNTPGSFYCQCPVGYNLQSADAHCQDIDECAVNQGLGPCMEHCHNSPGSYRCFCVFGHILAGDGHGCIAECPPGYRKQPPPPPPENSTAQVPKEECIDINECQEEVCEWQCINLPGSYRCICPRGYTLRKDGRHCVDINECSQKNGGCSHLCLNQRGGYKCACPASHRLSSYSWKKCLPRTAASTAG